MSGVDGVRSPPSPTPPSVGDLPGPGSRVEERPTVTDLARDVGEHLAWEGAAAGFEAAGCMALGAGASAIGWGIAIYHMGHAVGRSLVEGHREGLVSAALGGGGSPESRAFGAGIAASMLGATSSELGAMRSGLPRNLRDDFTRGVEHARASATDHAEAWTEATGEYRALYRDATDGAAAALGGWDDPSRGEAFRASRERTEAMLAANPELADGLRADYHAAVRAGFSAEDRGAVDEHRFQMDAAYRAGVTYHRGLSGPELESARTQMGGVAASTLSLGHVPITA